MGFTWIKCISLQKNIQKIMSDKTIHQSLLELEENLRSLESARKQVVNVTTSSEKVIEAFARILAQLEKLNEGFDTNNKEVLDSFDQVVEDLNASLKEESKKRLSDSITIQKKLSASVDHTVLKMESCSKAMDDMVEKFEEYSVDQTLNRIENQQNEILKNLQVINENIKLSAIDSKDQGALILKKIEKKTTNTIIAILAAAIFIVASYFLKDIL